MFPLINLMKEQYEEKITDETTRSSAKSRQSGDMELMCVVTSWC